MREFTKEFLDSQQSLVTGEKVSLSLGGVRDKWYIPTERIIVKEVAKHSDGYYMEHLVEMFGSHLSEYLGIDAIHQEMCKIIYPTGKFALGVYSKNFRRRGEIAITMEELLSTDGIDFPQYTYLSDWEKLNTAIEVLSKRLSKKEAFQYMSDMCLIDYLIGNPDRHIQNYGVIKLVDRELHKFSYRQMPLFDFGQGMLSVNRNIDELTSLDMYSAYMVVNSSAIRFDTMLEYFEEHWRYTLRDVQDTGFPLSVLQGIHPQGVTYFTEACRKLEVEIK